MEFWDCQPERVSYTRLSTLPCAGGFIVGLFINFPSISNAPESEAPVWGSDRVDSRRLHSCVVSGVGLPALDPEGLVVVLHGSIPCTVCIPPLCPHDSGVVFQQSSQITVDVFFL
jgi:hypothetical protein